MVFVTAAVFVATCSISYVCLPTGRPHAISYITRCLKGLHCILSRQAENAQILPECTARGIYLISARVRSTSLYKMYPVSDVFMYIFYYLFITFVSEFFLGVVPRLSIQISVFYNLTLDKTSVEAFFFLQFVGSTDPSGLLCTTCRFVFVLVSCLYNTFRRYNTYFR